MSNVYSFLRSNKLIFITDCEPVQWIEQRTQFHFIRGTKKIHSNKSPLPLPSRVALSANQFEQGVRESRNALLDVFTVHCSRRQSRNAAEEKLAGIKTLIRAESVNQPENIVECFLAQTNVRFGRVKAADTTDLFATDFCWILSAQ